MNSILYILSNEFENITKFINLVNDSNLIITVDGGLSLAKKHNIVDMVELAIGDFDTCKNPDNIIDNSKILKFPTNKDLTDTVLAYNFIDEIVKSINNKILIDQITKRFKTEFNCISPNENIKNIIYNLSNKINANMAITHIFYSISGKREDHFISLIFYFASIINDLSQNNKIILQNDNESIFILGEGIYKIYGQKGKIFSFFPLSKLTDVVIEPIEYKFPSNLGEFFSIGISNIFKSDEVTVKFKNGKALLFIENKDGEKINIQKL